MYVCIDYLTPSHRSFLNIFSIDVVVMKHQRRGFDVQVAKISDDG